MTEVRRSRGDITRRDFIKYGLCGACALCTTGISALAPGTASAVSPEKGLVNPRRSPWCLQLTEKDFRCTLCPHLCRISPGKRGRCGVRENRAGSCYTLAYANPALVQATPVERIPFFQVMPGIRTLAVSTAGCPLECRFCEVWDMALIRPEEVHAYDLSPEDAVSQARSAGAEAVAYAFGEPVAFYEYMSDTAAAAKKEGLLNLVHTSGYILPEPLEAVIGSIDAVNVDLKAFDDTFYRRMTGGSLEPVKSAMKMIKEAGVHLEITNLVIPAENDDMDLIKKMCLWIKNELGPEVPIHFARFYPLYKLSNLPPTPVSTLDRARDTAMEAGLSHVYVAKVTGHEGENTFCRECGKKIIDRMGFVIEDMQIERGRCSNCGTRIHGIWN